MTYRELYEMYQAFVKHGMIEKFEIKMNKNSIDIHVTPIRFVENIVLNVEISK